VTATATLCFLAAGLCLGLTVCLHLGCYLPPPEILWPGYGLGSVLALVGVAEVIGSP
jgi:hypothetical protein